MYHYKQIAVMVGCTPVNACNLASRHGWRRVACGYYAKEDVDAYLARRLLDLPPGFMMIQDIMRVTGKSRHALHHIASTTGCQRHYVIGRPTRVAYPAAVMGVE